MDIQNDILDCDEEAFDQIRTFLYELQDDPLPMGRQRLRDSVFYVKLPCGYFVGWEIVGDVLKMALTQDVNGITVRIVGVGRRKPIR